ncbi:MAG: ABC transporter substrate-binding protein [Candidatus Daviesbacteria bacterium]|nr:ABC transporter substrate-binding protein [Candidatus Daviesbacteria bacterium]
MKKGLKIILPLLFVVIIGSLFFIKNSNTNTLSAQKPPETVKPKITLVYSLRVNQLPVAIAFEKGLFDKYNLQVETTQVITNSVSVLSSGKADVSLGSPNISLTSVTQGSELSWIGNVNNDQGTVLVSTKTPANIKTVGVISGPSKVQTIGLLDLIKVNTENLIYQNFSDGKTKLTALKEKQVDAIHIAKPDWLIFKEKAGLSDEYKVLLDSASYKEAQMPVSIIVRNEFLKNNPQIVENFTKALIEADYWIKNNKEEFISILQKRYADVPPEDIKIEAELYFANIQNLEFSPTQEKGKEMLKLVTAANPKAKDYDINNFINTGIADSLKSSGFLDQYNLN